MSRKRRRRGIEAEIRQYTLNLAEPADLGRLIEADAIVQALTPTARRLAEHTITCPMSEILLPPACSGCMKDDAETLLDHMNRLQELTELAQYAAPEDRARIGHFEDQCQGAKARPLRPG